MAEISNDLAIPHFKSWIPYLIHNRKHRQGARHATGQMHQDLAVAGSGSVPCGNCSVVREFVDRRIYSFVQTFSEEGGYFFSDNFTSNEDPYLAVVGKIEEPGATGGVYIGVGPEQNFTYIADVRPRIASIDTNALHSVIR